MGLFEKHPSLGIFLNGEGAAAVLLSYQGAHGWRVTGLHTVRWQDEGLTDAEEVRQASADWVQEKHLSGYRRAACGIPQKIVNTVISDFPPVHDRRKLSRMIAFQTGKWSGLSGMKLVNAFQEVMPIAGQVNPMLIAVTKEDDLDSCSEIYQDCSLDVGKMIPAGLALYNAFAVLLPEAFAHPRLQAILECGIGQSLLVLAWNGRIQSAVLLDTLAGETAEFRRGIQNAFRVWKDTQTGDGRLAVPEKVWITGSLSAREDFREELAAGLGLPVELFGIPVKECPEKNSSPGLSRDGVYPAATIAFGLAVQNLGIAPLNLSLLPERIVWCRDRLAQFPYLALAVLMAVMLICAAFFHAERKIRQEEKELSRQEEELDICLDVAPRLLETHQRISLCQKQMLPIAEAALRTRRYLQALRTWHDSMPEPRQDGWCIYLADQFFFQEKNAAPSSGNTASPTRKESPHMPIVLPDKPATVYPPAETPASETGTPQLQVAVMPPAIPVGALDLLTKMYAGGILVSSDVQYQTVKEFQGALNHSQVFTNVDDYRVYLSEEFASRYMTPWETFLTEYRELLQKDYTIFFLQLPFLDTPIHLPPQGTAE